MTGRVKPPLLVALAGLALLGSNCAAWQDGAREAPRPAVVYRNAIEPEDAECGHDTPCDRYRVVFAAGDHARFELRPSTVAMEVIVFTTPTSEAVRARAEPGASAVVTWDFEREEEAHVEIRVGARGAGIVDYELSVSPGPNAEIVVPRPVMSWDERVARITEGRPPIPELAMADVEGERRLRKQLAEERMTPVPLDASAPLDAFTPLLVPLEAGYCYRVAFELTEGSTLGPFAERGLTLRVRTEDGNQDVGLTILGSRGLGGRVCTRNPGDGEVTLEASYAPHDVKHDGQLGAGSVRFSLHRTPVFPGLFSADDLAARALELTSGFSVARSFSVDMATLDPVAVPVERGKCYVAVMRLAAGARWSETSIERGIRVALRSDERSLGSGPGVVGPGAVSSFGCADATGSARLEIDPTGTVDGVGTGALEVQLYTRITRPGELEKMEADSVAEAEATSRAIERTIAEHCARCRRDNFGDKDGIGRCAAQIGPSDGCF